jgi:3-oxoacyl-[acyl-carrier-protein] synthase II
VTPALSHDDDPVITGIGAITPLAHTAPETWDGLIAGRSGVGPVTRFDASDLPVRIAAEVRGFDPEAALGPKRSRRTARFSQLAIVAARRPPGVAGDRPQREAHA